MKCNAVFLLTLILIISACDNDDSKDVAAEKESYEMAKQSLKDKEIKHPESFLRVTGNDKHNLIGQTVIKGSITNTATVAIYKDVELRLDFYSKTKALLETDEEIVYETIHPGETKAFKTKYFAPKGSDSVALRVLGAKVEE